jgi:hypothetical protein
VGVRFGPSIELARVILFTASISHAIFSEQFDANRNVVWLGW